MADERILRIARNEVRFRDINEALRADLDTLVKRPEHVPFICECGARACVDTVEVAFDEYERVRASALRFLIFPGHDIPDAEDIVESHERYAVVEKHADAAAVAEATDPRSDLRPVTDP